MYFFKDLSSENEEYEVDKYIKIKLNVNKILKFSVEFIMEYINKNSLIVFGYSETLTLALLVNSKLVKVKEFNILEDNNEDIFFKIISNFISNKTYFTNVFYSRGPGSFSTIRRIISFIKALKINYSMNTKFIGLNHLFIIACYLNYKFNINDTGYVVSILNHSRDNFIQIYKKNKSSFYFLDSLSDIKDIKLDFIDTYLVKFNLSIQNVHSAYLGINPNSVSFINNVQLVNRSDILETIAKISDLFENHKISQTDYKHFEEKFNPLYGKLPSTN